MPKRTFQRIYKHGNATAVTIPRYLLFDLGWLPGQYVILELLEDHSVRVRTPQQADCEAPAATDFKFGREPQAPK